MVSDVVASYWYGIDKSMAHYAYEWNKDNYYAHNDGVKPNGKDPWIGFWYPAGYPALGILSGKRTLQPSPIPFPERAGIKIL